MAASEYLMKHLAQLEDKIAKHEAASRLKKYLIYRKGSLWTGTNSISDVWRLCENDTGLFTYKINERHA